MYRPSLAQLFPRSSLTHTRRQVLGAVGRSAFGALFITHSDVSAGATVKAPYVRPNVHHLDPEGPELTSFANGVKAMKNLPDNNPLSWNYQANIHWTPLPNPSSLPPGWN